MSALAPVIPLHAERPSVTSAVARHPSSRPFGSPVRRMSRRAKPVCEQLTLPFEWEVAPGVPAMPPAPAHLRLVGADETAATIGDGPKPEWVARMALAVYEVGHGLRPAGQLTRWVRPDELGRLESRGRETKRHPSTRVVRPTATTPQKHAVRSIRVCPVSPTVYETSAVIVGTRGTAVGLRLERVAGQWLVTELCLG